MVGIRFAAATLVALRLVKLSQLAFHGSLPGFTGRTVFSFNWSVSGFGATKRHITSDKCSTASGGLWQNGVTPIELQLSYLLLRHKQSLIVHKRGGVHGCAWCISYRKTQDVVWVFLKSTNKLSSSPQKWMDFAQGKKNHKVFSPEQFL